MLNELQELSKTLSSNEIRQQSWHDQYGGLPSGNCYRIWLDEEGSVADVELMEKDLVEVCRKFGNNQKAFPAFNIAPLYRITSDEAKRYYDDLYKGKKELDITYLQSICTANNWTAKLSKKISGCLRMRIPNIPDGSAMSWLMRITASIDVSRLYGSLEQQVWKKIPADIKTYLPLLIHKGDERKKQADDFGSVPIIFDLANWQVFGYPIANEKTTKQVNDWLSATENDNQPDTSVQLDAFGSPFMEAKKVMPNVRLVPGFSVTLRSMFSEQVCQHRYGKADADSFPVSKANRSSMKTALEWMVRPENENVTWRKIDKDAMLFVYPNKLPKILPKFAALFGNNENDNRFEMVAEDFIRTLNGLETKQKPENIHVFALQQMQPALSNRAKVIFSRNITPDMLINAAVQWQQGCRNLPPVAHIQPVTPFPLNISKTANKAWKRDGTRADGKTGIKLMRYYEGLELLLDNSLPQIQRIAGGVTANSLNLMLFVLNNLPRAKKPVKEMIIEEIGDLLHLLGLLLFKSDITKEVYMQDTAYLIGQALKISDELHALYCEIKRDGEVPPQLVGNSVFVMASETPVQALAMLGTRMVPYLAWADQYGRQGKEKSRLVSWYKRQYGLLMPQLRQKLTDHIRLGALEKAQLFIGYLADLPQITTKQFTEQEESTDEK
jgi:hypothetical protein